VADVAAGLEITFHAIKELADECLFNDCTHTKEKGCAVLDALENGELEAHEYDNFIKLKNEKEYFELSKVERRQKEKSFGKMIKKFHKEKTQDKY